MHGLGSNLIYGDRQGIHKVLCNLIGNALKFTRNGDVSIEVSLDRPQNQRAELVIDVTDTGIGIEPEKLDRIFERFYTDEKSYDRLASGAGLVLAICRQSLNLMGGGIDVESVRCEGSTFRVVVPVETRDRLPNEHADECADSPLASLSGHRILLVEDIEINRVIVREMLESSGAQVVEAFNGAEAVEACAGQAFSSTLMDFSMPVMNGVNATKAIRSGNAPNAEAPIFALTAHALDEEQEVFRAAGMRVGLRKPVSRSELLSCLAGVEPATVATATPLEPPIEQPRLRHSTISELQDVFDESALETMLTTFEAEVVSMFDTVKSGLQDGTGADLAAIVHKSVGSAGLIGTIDLQQDLRALEKTFQSAGADDVTSRLMQAERTWTASRTMLREALLDRSSA